MAAHLGLFDCVGSLWLHFWPLHAAHLLGLPVLYANGFAILILLVFLTINLQGVGASLLSQNLVVLIKVAVLALIAAIGFAHFTPERLAPLADRGSYRCHRRISIDFRGLRGIRTTFLRLRGPRNAALDTAEGTLSFRVDSHARLCDRDYRLPNAGQRRPLSSPKGRSRSPRPVRPRWERQATGSLAWERSWRQARNQRHPFLNGTANA